MPYWTAAFLLLALIAGIMGLTGTAGLSWFTTSGLFLAGLVLALLASLLGQGPERLREERPRPRRYGGA